MLVVDASVVVDFLLDPDRLRARFREGGDDLHAPAHLDVEVRARRWSRVRRVASSASARAMYGASYALTCSPQLPRPAQQRRHVVPGHGEVREIVDGTACAPRGQRPALCQPSQRAQHLDVQVRRGVQVVPAFSKRARSRSGSSRKSTTTDASTTSTSVLRGQVRVPGVPLMEPRPAGLRAEALRRARGCGPRSWSRVGCDPIRTSSARRNSDSDLPSRAARARSSRCRSSGTCRICTMTMR